MRKREMEDTTFADVCKIMQGEETVIHQIIGGVFKNALKFFPDLFPPEMKGLAALAEGIDIKGAKEALSNVGRRVNALFDKEEVLDFMSKYERAQLAQVMIVFSAYFDTIHLYLPDQTGRISFPGSKTVLDISEKLEKYNEFVLNRKPTKTKPGNSILESSLAFPAPLESDSEYDRRLRAYYELLNEQFQKFFYNLSIWEKLPETEKDIFNALFIKLPKEALSNYKKQYIELENRYPEFKIWADNQQRYALSQQIDIGFKKLSTQIQDSFRSIQQSGGKGNSTLDQYVKRYNATIEETIEESTSVSIDDTFEESGLEDEKTFLDDVIFPAKKDIFIPQSFKALTYEKRIQLEPQKTWESVKDRDGIGQFIADTLRHPTAGEKPLIILGDPGSGKTLLCYMLAARILSSEYHVIIIRLRDIVADNTITQQINSQIEHDFANGCMWEDIAKDAGSKQVLLIFDGYDELLQASGRTYADYLNRIADFHRQAVTVYGTKVKSILTSRTALIDKALITPGTTVVKLCEFNNSRIETWTKIWNQTNREYFEHHNLEPFAVEQKSKVFELAKQPLLLLLLALYDTYGNALKKNADLTGVQLYDKIIRSFIEREQGKDPSFGALPDAEKEEKIKKEMNRLGIAALGMFNRRALFIRSEDLEKDLNYLLPETKVRNQTGGLKQSDQLLGHFFFLHHSKTLKNSSQNESIDTACEFMHNTFGEFLTANYIITRLKDQLNNIITIKDGDIVLNDEWDLAAEKRSRNFFCSLSYAPLSSRRVVVKMIWEWALCYLEDRGLRKEDIIDRMNFLLEKEIDRIISGEDIFYLNRVLTEQKNPFEKGEMLVHLACYGLNIIILSSIICEKKIIPIKREKWDKLISLWRYAFKEEELRDFSECFKTEEEEGLCRLHYIPDGNTIGDSQKHILQLARIYDSIGDNRNAALIYTLLGEGAPEQVFKHLKDNKFDFSMKYEWNRFMHGLAESQDIKYYLDIKLLNRLVEKSTSTGTIQDVLAVYLLVYNFFKENSEKENFEFCDDIYNAIIKCTNYFKNQEQTNSACSYYLQRILYSLSDILCNIHVSKKSTEQLNLLNLLKELLEISIESKLPIFALRMLYRCLDITKGNQVFADSVFKSSDPNQFGKYYTALVSAFSRSKQKMCEFDFCCFINISSSLIKQKYIQSSSLYFKELSALFLTQYVELYANSKTTLSVDYQIKMISCLVFHAKELQEELGGSFLSLIDYLSILRIYREKSSKTILDLFDLLRRKKAPYSKKIKEVYNQIRFEQSKEGITLRPLTEC